MPSKAQTHCPLLDETGKQEQSKNQGGRLPVVPRATWVVTESPVRVEKTLPLRGGVILRIVCVFACLT